MKDLRAGTTIEQCISVYQMFYTLNDIIRRIDEESGSPSFTADEVEAVERMLEDAKTHLDMQSGSKLYGNEQCTVLIGETEIRQNSVVLYRRWKGGMYRRRVGRYASLQQAEQAYADKYNRTVYAVDY